MRVAFIVLTAAFASCALDVQAWCVKCVEKSRLERPCHQPMLAERWRLEAVEIGHVPPRRSATAKAATLASL